MWRTPCDLPRPGTSDRADALVLVGGAGMGLSRRPMEPLKSWRWLASDEEKRDIHRQNLGILIPGVTCQLFA